MPVRPAARDEGSRTSPSPRARARPARRGTAAVRRRWALTSSQAAGATRLTPSAVASSPGDSARVLSRSASGGQDTASSRSARSSATAPYSRGLPVTRQAGAVCERSVSTTSSCCAASATKTIVCHGRSASRARTPSAERHRGHQGAQREHPLPQAAAEDALRRVARRTGHGLRLRLLRPEGDPRQPVREQVDPEDLRGQQRDRQADEGTGQHQQHLGRAAGQAVEQEAADVVVDAPSLLHGRDDGGERVVREDDVGGLAGDLGALPGPSRRRRRRAAARVRR